MEIFIKPQLGYLHFHSECLNNSMTETTVNTGKIDPMEFLIRNAHQDSKFHPRRARSRPGPVTIN